VVVQVKAVLGLLADEIEEASQESVVLRAILQHLLLNLLALLPLQVLHFLPSVIY